jgi:hypothetical protein
MNDSVGRLGVMNENATRINTTAMTNVCCSDGCTG